MVEKDADLAIMELGARLRARELGPDDAALARLRTGRRSAVAAMSAPANISRHALPFAAAAVLMVTVGIGMGSVGHRSTEAVLVNPVDDRGLEAELLIDVADLEFLDDLEFYAWLEMQAEAEAQSEIIDGSVTDG